MQSCVCLYLRLCFSASSVPTTTSATSSVVMKRWAQLSAVISQYFPIATVASREEHVVDESLTYAELLKKDGTEEDADIFALYLSSLHVTEYKTIGCTFIRSMIKQT